MGKLISIEGIDGAGKTTVISGTEDCEGLNSRIDDAVHTTEPNDETWIGKVVRKAISSDGPDVPPMSVFFLFLAEHANHVEDVVEPNLELGKTVICDRYIDSRYAYQSYEIGDLIEGEPLEWIKTIQEQKWTEIPDRTIILDIPVEVAMERIEGGEIFEKEEKLSYFRETYLELAESDPRYVVVDATQEPSEVITECQQIVEEV